MFTIKIYHLSQPTFAVRETDVSRHKGGTSGAPLKPSETIVLSPLGEIIERNVGAVHLVVELGHAAQSEADGVLRGGEADVAQDGRDELLVACVAILRLKNVYSKIYT